MPMVSPQLLPSTRLGSGAPLWDPFVSRSGSQDGSVPVGSLPDHGLPNAAGPAPGSAPGGAHGPTPGSASASGFTGPMSPTSASVFGGLPAPASLPGSLTNPTTSPGNALRALGGDDDVDVLPPLAKGRAASLGSLASSFRPFSGESNNQGRPMSSLVIQNLPRDITRREIHLLFTFATDYVSCDITKQGVAEDGLPMSVSAVARFRSVQAATTAQGVLEHRPDIFGDMLYSQQTPTSHWPLKCEVRSGSMSVSGPSSAANSTTSLTSVPGSGPRNPKSRFLFMGGAANGHPEEPASTNSTAAPGPQSSSSVSTPTATDYASAVSSAGNSSHSSHPHQALSPTTSSNQHNPLSNADRMFSPSSPRNNMFNPGGRSIFSENEYLPPLASSLSGLHINALDRRSSSGNIFEEKSLPSSSQTAASPTSQNSSSGTSGSAVAVSGTQETIGGHRSGPPSRRSSVPARQLSQMPVDGALDPSKIVVPYNQATSAKALSIMQSGGRVMPPANPADQNPPCNTLYVGNLPPDTSEDELKDLFSSRPGYKRLCFRTKANGPMCFVEFDDETYAGRALEDLYGFGLSNSVKGGIRLSFSKNPLGVRSNRMQQQKSYGHY